MPPWLVCGSASGSAEQTVLKIRFVLGGVAKGDAPNALALGLDFLTKWNVELMQQRKAQGRPLPPLYSAGCRYQREDYDGPNPEDWRDAVEVVRRRGGDCEDLAAYRAAELNVAGMPARCVFVERKKPHGRLFHIVVSYVNRAGVHKLDDPSRRLGMGRE